MTLDEVVEADHADHARGDGVGQRRLVDRRVVHAAAALDRMDLDAERALERGDGADRADDEPVREPVGHAEAARFEVRGNRGLVGLGRPVERVELVLREEPMVRGRLRILDVGEEPLEVVAIAKREPHDDAMAVRRVGAPVVDRRRDER